ncbi:MAG TPA: rhodanese-like domain-containing protein, partial [Candidatus Kapabacteria bacterium]|nr:rhodanese-like domain-containing protein [Candidatus Kapabacteria bacterium]
VLPGIIGTIQANETIKLLLGIGEPLIGRLLLFDALAMQFRELKLKKNPECPVCGEHPTVTHLIDYEDFCGLKPKEEPMNKNEITPLELKQRLDNGKDIFLLDVRQPNEHAYADINGLLIPLGQLPARFKELDPSKEIIVYCHSGSRSLFATQFLQQQGFTNVKNLTGGIDRWSREVDPKVPRY